MHRYRVLPPDSSQGRASVVTQPFSSLVPLITSTLEKHPVPIRGRVETFNATQGIEGWAVDLTDPKRVLCLQLMSGSDVLSECETELERLDVSAALGQAVVSGFRF